MWFFKKKKKPEVTFNEEDLYMDFLLGKTSRRRMYMMELPFSNSNERLTPSKSEVPLSEEKISEILNAIAEENRRSEEDEQAVSGKKFCIEVPVDAFERRSYTFQEMLLRCLEDKNMSNVEFYKAAWIDRKLFSAINSNVYYKPKKETAVACCLGLQLNMTDTRDLLETAGYALSDSIKWDMVIKYCIQHRIYAIDQVNQVLYAAGEKCIGEK